MYLRKIEGVRAVTLPNGHVLSQADLPAPGTRRWVASRKRIVVDAVEFGLISQETALRRYDLSEEELELWRKAVDKHGTGALKVTKLKQFR